MRTALLVSLLSLSFGVASLSLVIVHSIIRKQIRSDIDADLQRSMETFRNLQAQRQRTLAHEASMLAAIPVLKSLMTTNHARTIRDGAVGFFRMSGGDLFALADADGQAIAVFDSSPDGSDGIPKAAIDPTVIRTDQQRYLVYRGELYAIASQPLYFGPEDTGTQLGYVLLGFAIDHRVALEVSQAAGADVAFYAGGAIHAATLSASAGLSLGHQLSLILAGSDAGRDIWLGNEHFVGTAVGLSGSGEPDVQLIVLKSWDQASLYLNRLNRLLLGWGAFLLLLSALLAIILSSTVTRPLDRLIAGTRALGSGNFGYQLRRAGVREVRELGDAFDLMRKRLRDLHEELLAAERLATIGRMASSISHDLRHYLTAIYANAEFLGYDNVGPQERLELIAEIRQGVRGMTDLIESLLLFSRTGKSLHQNWEALPAVLERSLSLVRAHPDARKVEFVVEPVPQIDIWADVLNIERALCNLILNGCQAARHSATPKVHIGFAEEGEWLSIRIADNGPGVPQKIRASLFQPFVSEGKPSGMGLGLALALKIAQEHKGTVRLEESQPSRTVFVLSIARGNMRGAGATEQSQAQIHND